ncbi:hypothetical protein C5167_041648 [Papaver somniferum]|nr:hypothetical protein C5167_041648 [Papaver somniferum]
MSALREQVDNSDIALNPTKIVLVSTGANRKQPEISNSSPSAHSSIGNGHLTGEESIHCSFDVYNNSFSCQCTDPNGVSLGSSCNAMDVHNSRLLLGACDKPTHIKPLCILLPVPGRDNFGNAITTDSWNSRLKEKACLRLPTIVPPKTSCLARYQGTTRPSIAVVEENDTQN